MEKIEDFLEKNKWRLIDLFKELDKDKDWLILKSDLSRQCLKGELIKIYLFLNYIYTTNTLNLSEIYFEKIIIIKFWIVIKIKKDFSTILFE